MQPLLPREFSLFPSSSMERPAALSMVQGSRGTEFGVKWESPWREFFTSLRDLFTGPRPLKGSDSPISRTFRVDWIQGRMPLKEFLAACVWHVGVIWILILPIWGFLPAITPTLAPIQIEMTLYDPPDLPAIRLRAATPKAATQPKRATDAAQPAVESGADAYHPRQTIISIPVRVTHPRQTLIQPDAPPAPPKIVPLLPNIIQWASSEPVKPKPQYAPAASAPRVQPRSVRDADAPDAANLEKNSGPLNIAAATSVVPRPRIVLNPMSAPAAARRPAATEPVAAPEIGAAGDDSNVHRLIALSATPGPPAPELSIPQGNLAARISISPDGGKPGATGSSERAGSNATGVASSSGAETKANSAGNNGNAAGNSPAGVGTTGASSLPATISVSAGNARTGATSGGGIVPSGAEPSRLNLKPRESAQPAKSGPQGPVNVAGFDPSLPPEKILSGREIYTLHVNLPNLTSASGSWILNFSQLEEGAPPYRHDGELSGLAPLEKADPEYPPEMIKQHIHGEVVLYAIIRKDGSVDSVQIVRSLEPELDRNAINALVKWKFHPAARAGVPVDLEAVVHVPFIYVDPRN